MSEGGPVTGAQPLAYADPGLRRAEWRGALGRAFHARQLAFAAGLALVLGAFGYAVGHYTRTNSETPVCTTLGALLIGMAVPIRRHAQQ